MNKTRLVLRPCATIAALLAIGAGVTSAQTNTTYQYDSLGRLTRATDGAGNSITYSYDAAGNRTTSQAVSTAPPPPAPVNYIILPLNNSFFIIPVTH